MLMVNVMVIEQARGNQVNKGNQKSAPLIVENVA
jgi:hypothetical protein